MDIMTKSFKTKADYKRKEMKNIRKRVALFTIFAPFLLAYAVIENHFSPTKYSWKSVVIDFCVELWQAIKLVCGGKAYDYSVEISNYDFKQKAKKHKFDLAVATELADKFYKHNIRFSKQETAINYRGSDDVEMKITQTDKDSFKLYYYKFTWGKNITFTSNYSMTAEQLLTVVKTLKEY